MVTHYVHNSVFDLEASHITTRFKRVLEDCQIINLPDEGTGAGSKNTANARRTIMVIFNHLKICRGISAKGSPNPKFQVTSKTKLGAKPRIWGFNIDDRKSAPTGAVVATV
ncbi:hypothetical protein ED733_001185 [Metarhizium rileyi]|uniref:Uncharacterized protein n=1 Tax=Metarhizium rileyi (strain RCEF 4871) TaxID=1649241 RepID=A0A5C6G7E2_METRR|nr:hypothetical protein ED733_001185 [Metarhizium rileyi]